MSETSAPNLDQLDAHALRALARRLMGELEQRDQTLSETLTVVERQAHDLRSKETHIQRPADGIQTGDKAGAAHITVIFDPNGPYAAKLYTLLQKDHPDLAVRWVPIAYMTKTSAPLTALLIDSRSPQQDLNTDLADYNFNKRHGGIVPGSDRSSNLPAEQQHVFAALKKWGGYTPMIVFQDQAGRWLETGGSGSKVINSVLARAAK